MFLRSLPKAMLSLAVALLQLHNLLSGTAAPSLNDFIRQPFQLLLDKSYLLLERSLERVDEGA